MESRKVYMDHGATTPLREEVLEAMMPFLREKFGNPSSIHAQGREARQAVDAAREVVAAALGAEPGEIFFTSGGTESNNIALRGTAALKPKSHFITSSIEHHAVLDVCKDLEEQGHRVTFLPVDSNALVDPRVLEEAMTPDTAMVSVMMANNEVGTIQPIGEMAALAREKGVLFHTDAVQAIGQIPVNVKELQVDFLSLSAHKFNGPKGIGALYVRKGVPLTPLYRGGGQERKLRPGTENVAGIVGLARALELAVQELPEKMSRLKHLRDTLIKGLLKIEDVILNGHPEQRLPGNVNVSFKYIEGESLLLSLDLQGVAASSGSACTSGSLDPSHVLMAMGLDHETAHGSLRLTLGRGNDEADVDYVLKILPPIVERLRNMSALYKKR
ncbi:MAG TPA: cysteine desulfurase NifS [Bacillota bacterium]|nr:cysteine desulfurase NifS [Bacillota bacterium]